MRHTQRPILCQKMTTMFKQASFSVGDRLPGERRLATMFDTSRNTIREVLCNLETMGYVEIRQKSGCYLKSKEGRVNWEMLRNRHSSAATRQLLETLSFVAPKLARTESVHLSLADIAKLEASTAKLGEAIVNFDISAVSCEYVSFFRILAEVSGNDYLILLLKELFAAAKNLEHAGTGLSEVQADSLFAYHVELFNALKAGHSREAEQLTEQCMQAFSQLVLPD
ncbi:FadR/GntR family transcriptional regulator [Pseudodesulfovibrio senegalensis]|uniref:FadR family transcriptional regulator n=1 Tax=Pseudodesulfovibrio senegalensis TaxID=1721087 RepID=A0A6N6N153_9BACT|nr:GntR family transcriptional regulator [Pseudodesulfovibrio senegalensis]KAB1440273.1 FadR family transcriptional regulator [Pseudodesulfovibrio senegalensis]